MYVPIWYTLFQPTPPRMGSDSRDGRTVAQYYGFQSTLPGWGATARGRVAVRPFRISIHAPRMGSDTAALMPFHRFVKYQSTLPGWGATQVMDALSSRTRFFQSTLPGWGATGRREQGDRDRRISIHAPRMGSDASDTSPVAPAWVFQSTLPGWGATGG